MSTRAIQSKTSDDFFLFLSTGMSFSLVHIWNVKRQKAGNDSYYLVFGIELDKNTAVSQDGFLRSYLSSLILEIFY